MKQPSSECTQRTLNLTVTNGDGTTTDNIKLVIEATDTVDDVVSKLSKKKSLAYQPFVIQ